jgi:uncharacterized membrane protein YedE/YeeE
VRFLGAAILLAALGIAAFRLHAAAWREAPITLLCGFALGAALQRSRFCFASAFRDLFLQGERRVMAGLLVALALGSVGYAVVFDAQMPDPDVVYLHPTAHINPAGLHLLVGGLAFGFGMSIGGGCISGNLYRLGEGSLPSVGALLGLAVGFNLGFLAWNWIWVNVVNLDHVVWFPRKLGYSGALALQLGLLAAAGGLVLRFTPPSRPREFEPSVVDRVLVKGWPAWAGAAVIAAVATIMFFRSEPLGVTGELSRVSRAIGIAPERLEGLDKFKGCGAADTSGKISLNGLFVLALVGGAACAALLAREFRVRVGTAKAWGVSMAGGVLMGFGAMISHGCTIGTLLSGVMAFSLSGWVFALGLLGGAWLGARALGGNNP